VTSSGRTPAQGAPEAIPGIPSNSAGPVFGEPWEAQAFAITVALHRRGLFTWTEWSTALAAEIKRAQVSGDPDTGETYYRHWLAALERLVGDKRLSDQAELARYRDAWKRAADRTPHGTPIELEPQDFGSSGARS
jgi:nitrile hydratase accessory protein